jgi:hypothetical protein
MALKLYQHMTANGVWSVEVYRLSKNNIWGHVRLHNRIGWYDWQINPDGIHYYNGCQRLIPVYVQEMILRIVALITDHPEWDNEQLDRYLYDY